MAQKRRFCLGVAVICLVAAGSLLSVSSPALAGPSNRAAGTPTAASSGWAVQPASPPLLYGGAVTSLSCPVVNWCLAVGPVDNASGSASRHDFAEVWAGSSWAEIATPGQATAVSCASSDYCLAVTASSAELWDGSAWATEPAPVVPAGGTDAILTALSCPENGGCMLVGTYINSFQGEAPLAEAWFAQHWHVLSAPDPAGDAAAVFNAVSCAGTSFCMAVGYQTTSETSPQTAFAEDWDGSAWAIVPPVDNPGGDGLAAVSCPSATSCTAIGVGSGANGPWAETWDGATWTLEAIPATGNTALYSVSCSGPSSCIAVGLAEDGTGHAAFATLWDGTSWATEATGAPEDSSFGAVGCWAGGACEAAGYTTLSSTDLQQPLGEGWDGASWAVQTMPSPLVGPAPGTLSGVSCVSGGTCMAVGDYWYPALDLYLGLAEQSYGSSWAVVPTPAVPGGELAAVSCSGPDACTAVGAVFAISGSQNTLAENWDGTSWTVQPTPNPPGPSPVLDAVSCPTASFCTAVGYTTGDTGAHGMFVEDWDGTAWTLATVPVVAGASGTTLAGVSCPTVTFCAAVGTEYLAEREQALALTWEGSSWAVSTTRPSSSFTSFDGVTCLSRSRCLAVGGIGSDTLAEAFTGTSWVVLNTPSPASLGDTLEGVSCLSVDSCTAVGTIYNTGGSGGAGPYSTLAEAWDGKGWTVQTTPNPAVRSSLAAVSCSAANACTAVGGDVSSETISNRDPLVEVEG
jgi:hypothetical protein